MTSRSFSLLVVLALLLAAAPAVARNCSADPYPLTTSCNAYGYVPSLPLNILAVVLYALCGIVFVINHILFKGWYFLALTFGTFMMAAGIAMRVVSYYRLQWNAGFIIMQVLVILSPCLLIAANYILLGRIAGHLDAQKHMFIRPSRVSWVFVISDIVTFLVQGGASGIASSDNKNTANVGEKILLAALIVQLVSFLLFTFMWCLFTYRAWRDPVLWDLDWWKPLNWLLGFNCVMFLIRSIFRTIEFGEGWDGKLRTHEAYWAALDCLPIFLAIVLYTWYWPSRILTPATKVVPQQAMSIPMEQSSYKSTETAEEPRGRLWA
ncbi:Protein RTA1 [Vanrija pseudolonga]|uniref:Protein RTA1 n=1 Tax=Vanrija pseudolonga TaxID=143232 RepID=A0AAF1BJM6_9TREE|nr:Protein RTA1 [Vanrija pseudolonga]